MPFAHYGVLEGDLVKHYRDDPDNQGRWYHVNLLVRASGNDYRCAIDVDSHQSDTGVEWKVIELAKSEWSALTDLAHGYHELARDSSSGAIDYIRSPGLKRKLGCVFVMMPDPITRLLMILAEALLQPRWEQGSNIDAANALEPLLSSPKRVFVFGEPFDTGFGMHNIHQNQGDPAGSQWWSENGIWQDGGTIIERADGSLVAFLNKFTSQAYRTDEAGHPA